MIRFSRSGAAASSIFALLWLALPSSPARADTTELAAGPLLVCDTPEEVEAVLTSNADDFVTRISQTNDRFGAKACDVVTAIFYKGDEGKTVISPDGAVRIIQVDMVGLRDGDAWTRLSQPAAKFAGVLEDSTEI